MSTTLKTGDRVRLRDSICFGTVTDVNRGYAGEARAGVMVEWDGCEGAPAAVDLKDVEFVRPPPEGWARCPEGMLRAR